MSLLDFSFAHKVREVFRDGMDSMHGLHKMIEETYQIYNDVNNLVTFIDNHDMDRFHINGQSKRRIEQSLVFLLTSREYLLYTMVQSNIWLEMEIRTIVVKWNLLM